MVEMTRVSDTFNLTYEQLRYYCKMYFLNDSKELVNEKELNDYINYAFNSINNSLQEDYEYHHIVPRFLIENNLSFKMSLKDHLYCHYLLAKVFQFEVRNEDYRAKAIRSLNLLYNRTKRKLGENEEIKEFIKDNFRDFVSNSLSQELKEAYKTGKRKPIDAKGEKNGRYNKEVSQVTRDKISKANLGKRRSKEIREKLSRNRKNNPKFQPPSAKGKKKVTNGFINKYVHENDLEEFLKNNKDFILGTKQKVFKNKRFDEENQNWINVN